MKVTYSHGGDALIVLVNKPTPPLLHAFAFQETLGTSSASSIKTPTVDTPVLSCHFASFVRIKKEPQPLPHFSPINPPLVRALARRFGGSRRKG